MSELAYEGNTDLAFDTLVFRQYATKYKEIAESLRTMAKDLDAILADLKSNGWTTPAGSAFHKLAQTDWEENIEKYADLLDTLEDILVEASNKYEDLVENHIESTVL